MRIGVKGQSNPVIAGLPRNIFKYEVHERNRHGGSEGTEKRGLREVRLWARRSTVKRERAQTQS